MQPKIIVCHKISVCTLRNNPSTLQPHNIVTIPKGGESMRNKENRKIKFKMLDGTHHFIFSDIIQCAGRLIKNKDLRLFIECPCYSYPLALPSTQSNATFTYTGTISFGTALNKLGDLCLFGYPSNTIHVNLFSRHTKSNILSNTGIREVNTLRHMSDHTLPGSSVLATNGLIIH